MSATMEACCFDGDRSCLLCVVARIQPSWSTVSSPLLEKIDRRELGMSMTGGAEDEKRERDGRDVGGKIWERKQWAGAGSRICQPGAFAACRLHSYSSARF